MFTELHEAIASLDVPPHGEAIVELHRLRQELDAALAEAEAAFAADGGFQVDGFASMAAFLRHRCRLAPGVARRAERRADRLAAWPEVLRAWQAGQLSAALVDIVVAEVPDRHVERFAATAAETCSIVSPLGLTDTRRALETWVSYADDVAQREAAEDGVEAPTAEPTREPWLSRTSGGVAVVKGELDPDSAAVTEHALRLAERPDVEGERRSPATRRADALTRIAQFYVDNHTSVTSTRRQERLGVTCDIVTLYGSALRGAGVRTAAQLEEFLARRPGLGALERGLFCDAFDGHGDVARTLDGNPIGDGLLSCISEGGLLERLLTVGSRVIDHGRSLRAHTASQWRAVAARDGGCRLGDCDHPVDDTHVHHVERWEAGGRTDLDGAVLLSPHCHTMVHQPGWHDRIEPDGTYVVTTPTGREIRSAPPGSSIDRPLPVTTTAEPSRPLPFDPVPTRSTDPPPPDGVVEPDAPPAAGGEPDPPPGEEPHERLARCATECARPGWRPKPRRRHPVDLLHDRWIVSLS